MQDCKPVSTPVDTSSKLVVAKDNDECFNRLLYQSAAYAVGNLARFSSKPTKTHWTACFKTCSTLPERHNDTWHPLHSEGI